MLELLNTWYRRHLSNPEALILLFMLMLSLTLVLTLNKIMAPVLVGAVIAYLVSGSVRWLERFHFPRTLAVSIMCVLYTGLFVLVLLWLLPLLWQQLSNLLDELPNMFGRGQAFLTEVSARYPDLMSAAQAARIVNEVKASVGQLGQTVLSASLASIPSVIQLIIYLVLVPLLVFFFLKDREDIMSWISQFLPQQRRLVGQVWSEVNDQIGNYIRGKLVELSIVAIVSAIAFAIMGLKYSLLLGAMVGISVLIPFIGAVVVTIPIVVIAYLQWGITAQFTYLMLIYGLIVLVDANILVPVLFSGTMNLHPVAIIIAILFFGGLWGFWGVFFAIPLATVVKAVISAWPRGQI